MSYQDKYLKYKLKYSQLKTKSNNKSHVNNKSHINTNQYGGVLYSDYTLFEQFDGTPINIVINGITYMCKYNPVKQNINDQKYNYIIVVPENLVSQVIIDDRLKPDLETELREKIKENYNVQKSASASALESAASESSPAPTPAAVATVDAPTEPVPAAAAVDTSAPAPTPAPADVATVDAPTEPVPAATLDAPAPTEQVPAAAVVDTPAPAAVADTPAAVGAPTKPVPAAAEVDTPAPAAVVDTSTPAAAVGAPTEPVPAEPAEPVAAAAVDTSTPPATAVDVPTKPTEPAEPVAAAAVDAPAPLAATVPLESDVPALKYSYNEEQHNKEANDIEKQNAHFEEEINNEINRANRDQETMLKSLVMLTTVKTEAQIPVPAAAAEPVLVSTTESATAAAPDAQADTTESLALFVKPVS